MQDAYTNYKDSGFEILAINLDSNITVVQDFIDRFAYDFKVLRGNSDVANQYRVRFVPKSLFLDPEGVIRFEQTGPIGYEEIVKIIEDMG